MGAANINMGGVSLGIGGVRDCMVGGRHSRDGVLLY